MIAEDYVSFEIAKLLKEKGFDYISFYCYEEKGINDILSVILSAPLSNSDLDNTIEPHKCYSAPTIQIAMKWLREVHRIDIEVRTHYLNYLKPNDTRYYSGKILKGSEDVIHTIYSKDTYEEVCEAAIKYCLENLV